MKNFAATSLDAAGFAASFGVSVDRLPAKCLEIIEREDFSFQQLHGRERDQVILEVLRRLEGDSQKIGAPERREVWEKGWREALTEYVGSNFSPSKLVPKFIRSNQPARLNRNYVLPTDPNFELHYVEVLREWLFREFFAEIDEVHEFGCGTGFNLISLATIYPDKKLFGSDFVPASVEIVSKIAEKMRLRISTRLFDMMSPPEDYQLKAGSGVFTFGSMEQLASRFEHFLSFLLDRGPRICVHVEPTVELYDETDLFDFLAIRFHRKRGYTEGYLPRLEQLAASGRIELMRKVRLNFGSLMMEGYNLIVWRPSS
jgi:hypothetical protein